MQSNIKNEQKNKIEKIITLKPNIINILQELQNEKGYLNRDDMIKISKENNIPTIDLYGVATFYSLFNLTPKGKNIITVCSGTACHVKKSENITEELEKILGIKRGNTTKDKKFTLETVNCIGACARAPAMMINNKVFGELTPKKLKSIINMY